MQNIWSEVKCGEVWWPILGICALHLTHPSAHTQQRVVNNTHTVNTHPEQWAAIYAAAPGEQLGFGALLKGLTSVMVLKVERALIINSPHLQFLPDLRLEPATFGLQVRLSSIRSWLPPKYMILIMIYYLNYTVIQYYLSILRSSTTKILSWPLHSLTEHS